MTKQPMPPVPAVSPALPADERLDNPVGYYRYGDAPETTPRPLKLHTQQVEGLLGGHRFSRDFARYLADVQPLAVERAEFARTHWWANPYWRARVKAQFVARFGTEGRASGALRYGVALALASGRADVATLKAALARTTYWIHHQREIAESFAQLALRRVVIATPRPTRTKRVIRPSNQRTDQTDN